MSSLAEKSFTAISHCHFSQSFSFRISWPPVFARIRHCRCCARPLRCQPIRHAAFAAQVRHAVRLCAAYWWCLRHDYADIYRYGLLQGRRYWRRLLRRIILLILIFRRCASLMFFADCRRVCRARPASSLLSRRRQLADAAAMPRFTPPCHFADSMFRWCHYYYLFGASSSAFSIRQRRAHAAAAMPALFLSADVCHYWLLWFFSLRWSADAADAQLSPPLFAASFLSLISWLRHDYWMND